MVMTPDNGVDIFALHTVLSQHIDDVIGDIHLSVSSEQGDTVSVLFDTEVEQYLPPTAVLDEKRI
jgi:hypothetical protein